MNRGLGMRTHIRFTGAIRAGLGVTVSLLALATCESTLLEEIRETHRAASETRYYTVTYDANGADTGEVPVDDARYEQGQTATVLGNDGDLQKADHNFAGWNTSPDGDGQPYGRGSPLLIGTANVTLYANWTQLQVYEVSFDSQGGSFDSPGNPEVLIQEVTEGNLAAQPTDPTRDGYTFGGWYKESGCTNAWNFSTDLVTESRSLYAKWTGIEYPVTLNLAGGSGGSTSVTPTYGSHMPQDDMTAPSKDGYNFGGYFTGTNGTGTQYYTASMSSARPWEETDVFVLYAKWTGDTYNVVLDRQHGNYGSQSVTATYGQDMPTGGSVAKPTHPRIQYSFGGYFTERHGEGTMYYDSDMNSARTWNIAENDHTLYAQWVGVPPAPTGLSMSSRRVVQGVPGMPNYLVYYVVYLNWSPPPPPAIYTGFEIEFSHNSGAWEQNRVVDENRTSSSTTSLPNNIVRARIRTLNTESNSGWVISDLLVIPAF